MKKSINDFDYNVFLCYRGIGDGERECEDGKYVALDIFHELQSDPLIKCFYAPKKYKTGDNFDKEIPFLLTNVKVVLLILTKGFFDGCFSSTDIVKKELDEIFAREKQIKIIPVVVKGYNIEDDREKIISLFSEKASDIITTKSITYESVYDFPDKSESLRSLIKQYLSAAKNNYSYSVVDNSGLLIYLDEICCCSSVTYALEKILDSLLIVLQQDCQSLDDIKNDLSQLIDKICERVPHFSTLKTKRKDELIKLLDECDNADTARDYVTEYKNEISRSHQAIIRMRTKVIAKYDNILIFSESKHVLNLLNSILDSTKKTCSVYICEARAKVSTPFEDAKKIYDSIHGYCNKYIITENSVYTLMKEGKINKVIIGACAVELLDNHLSSFINTSGTEILLNFAKDFSIPVYIISELDKKLSSFNNRENRITTKELIPEYHCDEINYIELNRTENLIFVSEEGIDVESTIKHYKEDIWKDMRELQCEKNIFIKSCTAAEYNLEKAILQNIYLNNQINIAKPIKFDDETNKIYSERIKGVRLFEFFVILDELIKKSSKKALEIKESLLQKCNYQQKIINSQLSSLECLKNLQVYPEIKITTFIPFLYNIITIHFPDKVKDIDSEQLSIDAEKIYSRFKQYVNMKPVPFRDSTIKNMALQGGPFDNLDISLETEQEKSDSINKVYNLINSKKFNSLEDIKIYDFDFSSCINSTTQYDDIIGLNMHERSYSIDFEKYVIKKYKGNEEFVISLIVRYLRFGGRKLAYKLLNPSFHQVRFKFDDEQFYFKKLLMFINRLYPEYETEFPTFYSLIEVIANIDIKSPKFDLFMYFNKELKRKSWMGMCKGNISDNTIE